MDYNIKPKKLVRQEKSIPLTIPQLIIKYKLDSLWKNIENIVNEVIEQNSGYVIKKDGVMYIADNNKLEKAKVVLRIGKNFLDISNNGIDGNYQTIISLDGTINADFIKTGAIDATKVHVENIDASNITSGFINSERIESNSIDSDKIKANAITSEKIATDTIEAKHIKAGAITADDIISGTMQADRIKGGNLTIGGKDNGNGIIDVQNEEGESTVVISNQGVELKEGSKLITEEGILTCLTFTSKGLISTDGEWEDLGYHIVKPLFPMYQTINIDIFIPENFIVKEAYLSAQFLPVMWCSGEEQHLGYCQNIDLYYKKQNIGKTEIPFCFLQSDFYNYDYLYYKDNTNSFSFSGSPDSLVSFNSKDLSEFLTPGQITQFQLRAPELSQEEDQENWGVASDYGVERAKRTGYAKVLIFVYGYMK